MSEPEREEERRKKSCSSTGLGLAAAAIGVGVGAALYYFLSKRPEDRESGASSSENWSYEPQQTFNRNNELYSTDSEHTTTDTSILDDSYQDTSYMEESSETQILSSEDDSDAGSNSSYASDTEESSESEDLFETGYNTLRNSQNLNGMHSDSDTDWDVTDSSLGVPEIQLPSLFDTISHHIVQVFSPSSDRKHRPNQSNNRTSKKFRERSWSLEECSICFEIMLQNQELMSLPCTHRFHVACIGPWLEAQQTCPNCRKSVE